ncbi:fibrinogen C domain-containing protein 1-like [Bactrocera tryoni]|uniref:fibrinogen C domain-containing protein 1-like n=1 Tax=Bactrocera tryoni TaxID=59916 RepID=UPI001A96B2F0|nr:fibrinogen C domain-containing protein 1-like [Bactrocera tryoni]
MFRFTFIIWLYCILHFQIRFCHTQDNSECGCICNSGVKVGVVEDNGIEDRSSEVSNDTKNSEAEKQPTKTSEKENPSTTEQGPVKRPLSCMEATAAISKSGVYKIQIPQLKLPSVDVYCEDDTDGGGWLVFQRRVTFEEDFFRDWESYKNGFGNVSTNFWFGLDKLHVLTSSCAHELYIKLKKRTDPQYVFYARYAKFLIGSESEGYSLKELSGYSGTAGESLIKGHLGMKFSTIDRDNDLNDKNCAYIYRGGWWHRNCLDSNLNGLFLEILHGGIYWRSLIDEPLAFSEMMIRPKQTCWRQLMQKIFN